MSFNLLDFILSILDFTAIGYLKELWGDTIWVNVGLAAASVLILATIPLLAVFFVGWAERKVLARMQDRIGPNRVGGKYGILQMFADVVKMITKEMIVPSGADKVAFFAGPILAVLTSVMLFAVMPFGPGFVGADLNIGIFYVLSISSVSVVALLLAGWGSNNKYALLGAFRAVAQLVSYEVPMILSLLVPILLARTMSISGIVEAQSVPFIVMAPISALIFFVSALAETGRSPFDLLEAESEIIAGYHTEYTGMNFGLFQAGEYVAIFFMCMLFSSAFLGGYRFFGLEDIVGANGFNWGRGLSLLILILKSLPLLFVFMWLRGTLPRFRIDQLLNFNWKFMVPLTIVILFVVAILDKLIVDFWGIGVDSWVRGLIHLASQLVIGFATLEILRSRARKERLSFALEDYGTGGDDEDTAGGHGHDDHHGHGDQDEDHAHDAADGDLVPAH